MQGDKVEVRDTEVVVRATSAAEAREIAAKVDFDFYSSDRTWAQFFEQGLDAAGNIADVLGRPLFSVLSWALLIVGAYVAFISWSRLAIDPTVSTLFGIVGVVLIAAVKLSAGRWAVALNQGDKKDANQYATMVFLGALVECFVAVAFQAAVASDEIKGITEIDDKIEIMQAEIRTMSFEADEMERPRTSAEVLQLELNRLLGREARNRSGAETGLLIREVIAWDTDDYCMGGGSYGFYVEKYCPDVTEVHRHLLQRQAYDEKREQIELKRAALLDLTASRPQSSSGLALGKELTSGNDWRRFIPGMLLMAVILILMIVTAFVAKRKREGATP